MLAHNNNLICNMILESAKYYADSSKILKNNLKLIFLLVSPSCIYTTLNLIFSNISNGVIIGYYLQKIQNAQLLIFLTLPHGIFENPAIIIAGAAGFKIPYEITRYLAGRKEQILTRQDIKDYVTLALISIALIIKAAWVEANITIRIAESMMEK